MEKGGQQVQFSILVVIGDYSVVRSKLCLSVPILHVFPDLAFIIAGQGDVFVQRIEIDLPNLRRYCLRHHKQIVAYHLHRILSGLNVSSLGKCGSKNRILSGFS